MIEHLSYSSINTYLMCPRSWKYHYLDKTQVKTSASLIFGSAFHGAIEAYIRARNTDQAGRLASYWDWNWAEQIGKNPDIEWNGESKESIFNQGVVMLSNEDVRAVVDGLKPLVIDQEVYIERQVTLHVPGVPVNVIGYIDIITADGIPGDFKTSSRRWEEDKAANELQPSFYLAALNQNWIPGNPERKFRHYVFIKTKRPQVQVIETRRGANELMDVLRITKEVWDGISAEKFPQNFRTWKCSPRWCEYFKICRGAE
jgi:CRISPR/Cas system-associated exonuclease Cas4 (RecB family)